MAVSESGGTDSAARPKSGGGCERGETRGLTVARLARAGGLSPHTIRYYERQGLLPAPPREKTSGYRRYPLRTVAHLRFIKSLQGAGFTLGDIRRILRLADDPAGCEAIRSLARSKLAVIRERIAALERCAATLETVIDRCGRQDAPRCHLFDLLDEAEDGASHK